MSPRDAVSGPRVPGEKGDPPAAVDYGSLDKGSVRRTSGEAVHRTAEDGAVALTRLRVRGTVGDAMVAERIDTWDARSESDGVATVLDWTHDDTGVAVVTEPLAGGSLAERLADPDDVVWPDEAVWITDSVAAAVAAAHDQGVCHLALDPETVWFESTAAGTWDRPAVLGWGIRHALRESDAGAGDLRPAYAAPEQIDPGAFGDPGPRTDVYRLGALLYELLVGHPPRTGTGYEALAGTVTDRPVDPPSDAVGVVPGGLDEVVSSAMATDPRDRYDSAAALRDALAGLDLPESARSGDPVGAYPQFAGGPGHTGRARGEPSHDPEVASVGADWTARLGAAAGDPAVAYGTVYVGDGDGTLTAIRADTGDVRWSRPPSAYAGDPDHRRDDVAQAPPAVGGGVVVTGAAGRTVAFDAIDGSVRWHREVTLLDTNAPTVAGDRVYAVGGDDTLYALALDSGETVWTVTLEGTAAGGERVAPAVADGLVAVNTDDGVEGFDTETGAERWTYPAYFARPPSISDGRVYVGDEDTVFALDAADGSRRWRVDTTYEVAGPPAVGDDTVYVTVADDYGGVRAIDAETGDQSWQYDLETADREREPMGNAVLTGDRVVVPLASTLAASDDTEELLGLDAADGTDLWRHDLGGRGHGAVVPLGEQVVLGTEAFDVAALSLPTAEPAAEPDADDGTEGEATDDRLKADAQALREAIEPDDSLGRDWVSDHTGWSDEKTEAVLDRLTEVGVVYVDEFDDVSVIRDPETVFEADVDPEAAVAELLEKDARTLQTAIEAEPDGELGKAWIPEETGWSDPKTEAVLDRLEAMGVVRVDGFDDVSMVGDPSDVSGASPDDGRPVDEQLLQDARTLQSVVESEIDNQLDRDWVPEETGWSEARTERVLDRLQEAGVVDISEWDEVSFVGDPEDALAGED